MSKLISKITNSIWKYNLTLRTKINSIYSEQHPVLKFAASLTGSLLIQRLDYQLLQKALNKEFAYPESDQGLVAALETIQGRHEPLQAYYSRLRLVYF